MVLTKKHTSENRGKTGRFEANCGNLGVGKRFTPYLNFFLSQRSLPNFTAHV